MAVELERFINDQLKNLPPDHPDREYLKDLLVTTKSYIEGTGPDVAELTIVEQELKEYQSQPHTPELVTKVFQTIWQERGELVGKTYEVSPCPFTQEELTNIEQNGKTISYLPMKLATQQRRYILGKMFPLMRSGSVRKGNPVTNDENPSGWFDYEAQIGAPNWDTNKKQFTEEIAEKGRKLLSLNQYIVASQDNKLLTGQYLDEKGMWIRRGPVASKDNKLSTGQYLVERATWTELGSRLKGRVVWAFFFQDGSLYAGGNLYSDGYYFYSERQRLGIE